AVGWVLDRLFIEDGSDKPKTTPMTATPAGSHSRIDVYQQWGIPPSKRSVAPASGKKPLSEAGIPPQGSLPPVQIPPNKHAGPPLPPTYGPAGPTQQGGS